MTQPNTTLPPAMAESQPVPTPAQQSTGPRATLEEYAQGLEQVNRDLQRSTAAYKHFRGVLAQLEALAQNPQAVPTIRLPFLAVRFPQEGPAPGEMKVDMNTLSPAMLVQLVPLFQCLTKSSGENLLTAWDNIHGIDVATQPIVTAAKQVQGADCGRQ